MSNRISNALNCSISFSVISIYSHSATSFLDLNQRIFLKGSYSPTENAQESYSMLPQEVSFNMKAIARQYFIKDLPDVTMKLKNFLLQK